MRKPPERISAGNLFKAAAYTGNVECLMYGSYLTSIILAIAFPSGRRSMKAYEGGKPSLGLEALPGLRIYMPFSYVLQRTWV